MSDRDIGKKMVEAEDLRYFLEAYERVTGEKLIVVGSNESPDFRCSRKYGEEIGVEIAEIARNPSDATLEEIIKYQYEQDPWEAFDEINRLINKKDKLRSSKYGRWADKTILVLKLSDCFLSDILFCFEGMEEEYAAFGFLEIWLIDLAGDIELFGLTPAKWWGYHQ